MINRAQATLEFTVVFIIIAFLLIGMLSLWKWSSDRIVKRQLNYNDNRITAGTKDWAAAAPVIMNQGTEVVIIRY
jgi:hypothetical protein